jgi:tetrapyrrole methylase family protein/MazG family protein
MTHAITLLGLGPGDPDQLTIAARRVLQESTEIHLRTRQHPTVAAFPDRLAVHSFDGFYKTAESFEALYERIVAAVLDLARRPEGVVYGVPGHPLIAETTGPEILRRAAAAGLSVRVVGGLSFLEPVFEALAIDPYPQTALVDAFDLARGHVPSARPDRPALIAQIHSRQMASEVKLTLMALYPDEHPVRLVHAAGTASAFIEDLELWEIDRSDRIGLLTSLYLPPLAENTSFESFLEIVSRLRDPDEGCPWDQEQTHLSLRPHLLEETYEALDALDREAPEDLAEELGDLLFQVVFHAVIAAEEGTFTMANVIKGIGDKLVRRHPHVFAGLAVEGVDEIVRNWDRLKAEEKQAKGAAHEAAESILNAVPGGLPALAQASALQRRASRTGFEWPDVEGVFEKLEEELAELRSAPEGERESELGDVLFVLAHLANWYGFSAEDALRETNLRFRGRFGFVERAAKAAGRELPEMTLDEMNALWEQAKRANRKN